jgi:hypothetical protein
MGLLRFWSNLFEIKHGYYVQKWDVWDSMIVLLKKAKGIPVTDREGL